jgi:phytoene desaturase
MNQINSARFKDPRIAQLFNRFATYNGSNPYRAPATLNLIAHLEHSEGAFYPEGGIRAIANALEALCLKTGVEIRTRTQVEQIHTKEGKVTGVSANGAFEAADVVVCNADIRTAYEKLLPQLSKPRTLRKQEPSSSALIFYWGIDGHFPDLELHNLFFSDAYEEEFQALQQGNLFLDPSVYVYLSQRINSNDAPQGCENWFVMVNAPYVRPGQDWERMKEQARINILAKLEHRLKQRIRDKILVEEVLDPRGIEQLTASWKGALYGSSSNNPWSAFLRQANFHPKVKGLFFCGGSVHPGGGIPLCLLSASITSKLIK